MPDDQMELFPEHRTLANARSQVQAELEKGIVCPCCDQFAKIYARKFYSTMARWLIALFKANTAGDEEWFHVNTIWEHLPAGMPLGGGDFPKSRFWGLIEEDDNDDSKKKSSGVWRIAQKGIDFVLNRTTIPHIVRIYNNEPLGFDGPNISIVDALGDKFNYAELMALTGEYDGKKEYQPKNL